MVAPVIRGVQFRIDQIHRLATLGFILQVQLPTM